jgi:hypothetical protein
MLVLLSRYTVEMYHTKGYQEEKGMRERVNPGISYSRAVGYLQLANVWRGLFCLACTHMGITMMIQNYPACLWAVAHMGSYCHRAAALNILSDLDAGSIRSWCAIIHYMLRSPSAVPLLHTDLPSLPVPTPDLWPVPQPHSWTHPRAYTHTHSHITCRHRHTVTTHTLLLLSIIYPVA